MTDEQKRIANQREEILKLQKRLQSVTQSRDFWKAKAKRVGKQLHETLHKEREKYDSEK